MPSELEWLGFGDDGESTNEGIDPEVEYSLLDPLSPEDRRDVLANSRRRRFAKGEVVFHEGDPGDTLHLLASGHVAVRVTTPVGDVATLNVLGAGDFFGELALIAPGPRIATIVALDRVDTLTLHRDRFNELRRSQPAVERFLLEATVVEVRRLSTQLLEALYVPVEKRIPRRLLELAELYDELGPTVVIPLTQEDIAGLVGTTRPTVNKALRNYEEAGWLSLTRGAVEIRDRAALAARGR